MLLQLSVENFVLIDSIRIDFERGLTVFTGETGAGKSLMVDALSLLSGARALTSFVGNKRNTAVVEGVFRLEENTLAAKIAKAYDFDVDDVLVFTREISKDNKNLCKINHRMVPLSTFKEILDAEIDIHSQHDTQYLLQEKNHIRLLDNFLQNPTLLTSVHQAYQQYMQAKKQTEEIQGLVLNENDREFLEFQLNELQTFLPSVDDYEALLNQQKQMMAYEKISINTSTVLEMLNQDKGVLENTYESYRLLQDLDVDDSLKNMASMMVDAYSIIEEAKNSLSDYVYNLSFDQETFDSILERLAMYDRLKRKHGGSVEALLDKMHQIEDTLYQIDHHQHVLENAKQEEVKALLNYQQHANELSKARQTAAKHLSKNIASHLSDLQLVHAQFNVVFEPINPTKTGMDKVIFYLKTNPGSSFAPLAKIASGGELSRLMLGLKAIFTPLQGCGTIIFDEIDVGVSGAVAYKVGAKMHQLAQQVQTFTITHLPVVACFGNHHFNVIKTSTKTATIVSIEALNEAQRIEQLAQLASGNASQASLEAAKQLLHQIQAEISHE